MGKAHYNVLGKILMNFKEISLIHQFIYHLVHIVGLVLALRDDAVQFWT